MTDYTHSARAMAAACSLFEAARNEYRAAALIGGPGQVEAARQKCHDALDALLDREDASLRELSAKW